MSYDGAPARAGDHADCVSLFGAYDMVGNVWEWVGDWFGMDRDANALSHHADWGTDETSDVSPAENQGDFASSFPAAAIRGGDWVQSTRSGAFALSLTYSPSYHGTTVGARCCIGGR